MRGVKAHYPGCNRLHGQTSAGRERRLRRTVAGYRRNAGSAQWRTSTLASCRANNSATDSGRTPCNRFKLRTQSASSWFATPKAFAGHDYVEVVDPMIVEPPLHIWRRSGLHRGGLLTLQEAFRAVPSASAMRKPVLLLVSLLASAGLINGEIKTPENVPIEITSSGETTYENGLATARENVAIHVGDTDIYADYAQY